MKNGKLNNFKDFHKLNDKKLQYLDKIIWNNDVAKKLKIEDILMSLQLIDNEIGNKLNITLDTYMNYKVIGYIPTDNEYIYLLTDKDYKILHISIGKSHPMFWYKFTTKKEFIDCFDQIYETYIVSDFDSIKKRVRVFIGDSDILSIDIHDIENHLIMQKYTDKLIYGSLWHDHPFRSEYDNKHMDPIKSVIFTGQAMRQDEEEPYSVSVRTLYSKSLITIHNYDDSFILEITYNPIDSKQIIDINNMLTRSYNTDLPIDVLITILGFPFISHIDLIKMRPLTPYHIFIIDLIVMDDNNLVVELEEDFNTLLDNKEKDNFDESIYTNIKMYIELIKDNKLFIEIIKDKDVDDFIEHGDIESIENTVQSIMEKYDCKDNIYIYHELTEFILMHLEDEESLIELDE